MTPPQNIIRKAIDDINDALTTLSWDIEHKYHSAMDHFDLLTHMNNLKAEKAKLEGELKSILPYICRESYLYTCLLAFAKYAAPRLSRIIRYGRYQSDWSYTPKESQKT